jgi:alpha-tubulin suppressor-like RCC1 family protein
MVSVYNDCIAAICADGTLRVWGGSNEHGEQNVPVDLRPVIQVSVGDGFVLAVQDDGTVRGWGKNDCGQVTSPEGLTNVVAVSAGRGFAYALKDDGSLVYWGTNAGGQLLVPEDVQTKGVKAVACSGAKIVFVASDTSVTTMN